MNNGVYSVAELNAYIKNKLDLDPNLRLVKLEGELNDVKVYPSGHMYFNVIDDVSSISGVMFSRDCAGLEFKPKTGDKVLLIGSISTYIKTGRYQFYAREMFLDGEGARLLKLAQLKKKLETEGLFDASHKRKINIYPRAIGLVTAKGSAAMADLISNIHRRFPLVNIYTFYSQVQGNDAPRQIVEALKKAYTYPLDTIIVGRGGGSNDDLNAFNDEMVVRTAYASPFPLIAAVGHEIDFTLLDFVADARASTPTGAAELATCNKLELFENLDYARERMASRIVERIKNIRERLNYIKTRPFFVNPSSIYRDELNEIKLLKNSLNNVFTIYLNSKMSDLSQRKERLEAINPSRVLKRGFALLRTKNGQVIKQIDQVNVGEMIETTISDGTLKAVVSAKEKHV